jgi:hypothetical protein
MIIPSFQLKKTCVYTIIILDIVGEIWKNILIILFYLLRIILRK